MNGHSSRIYFLSTVIYGESNEAFASESAIEIVVSYIYVIFFPHVKQTIVAVSIAYISMLYVITSVGRDTRRRTSNEMPNKMSP